MVKTKKKSKKDKIDMSYVKEVPRRLRVDRQFPEYKEHSATTMWNAFTTKEERLRTSLRKKNCRQYMPILDHLLNEVQKNPPQYMPPAAKTVSYLEQLLKGGRKVFSLEIEKWQEVKKQVQEVEKDIDRIIDYKKEHREGTYSLSRDEGYTARMEAEVFGSSMYRKRIRASDKDVGIYHRSANMNEGKDWIKAWFQWSVFFVTRLFHRQPMEKRGSDVAEFLRAIASNIEEIHKCAEPLRDTSYYEMLNSLALVTMDIFKQPYLEQWRRASRIATDGVIRTIKLLKGMHWSDCAVSRDPEEDDPVSSDDEADLETGDFEDSRSVASVDSGESHNPPVTPMQQATPSLEWNGSDDGRSRAPSVGSEASNDGGVAGVLPPSGLPLNDEAGSIVGGVNALPPGGQPMNAGENELAGVGGEGDPRLLRSSVSVNRELENEIQNDDERVSMADKGGGQNRTSENRNSQASTSTDKGRGIKRRPRKLPPKRKLPDSDCD